MLHLLRPFTQWTDPDGTPIRTVDRAEEFVRYFAEFEYDKFTTWTRRRPTRAAELEGGSVYFVKSGITLFRMPFIGLRDNARPLLPATHAGIDMRSQLIRVQPINVGMVRGWRYLRDADAPADVTAGDDGELPPDMLRELRDLGLG